MIDVDSSNDLPRLVLDDPTLQIPTLSWIGLIALIFGQSFIAVMLSKIEKLRRSYRCVNALPLDRSAVCHGNGIEPVRCPPAKTDSKSSAARSMRPG